MRLTALSTGYAIPQADFEATVHSVFPAAVNLRPAHEHLLLSLVAATEADLPQGMRLDTPAGFSFEKLNVGGHLTCLNSTLVFGNSNLVVQFHRARRWRCDLPAHNTDLTDPAVAAAWVCVWQALNERQRCQGAEIIAQDLLRTDGKAQSAVSRRLGEVIRSLIEATGRYQLDDPSPLTGLVGLGSGLTPCGDDFLVGYLVGLWCTVRDFTERRQAVSRLGQAIIHLSGRTNDISRTYLYHAAQGQVSSRLDTLAGAISKPESPGQLLVVAESAMQAGHTSGMDAVAGLLFGLVTWESNFIPGAGAWLTG